jgi:hypothetical protein
MAESLAGAHPHPFEPTLRGGDLRLFGAPAWSEIDRVASAWLGTPCLALPSIRVGLCWVLEHCGYARHRDHVLVPKFTGRCILNALGRYALPVEVPTPETRIALVVDAFGLRHDRAAQNPEFERRGWRYVEDSPYGIGDDETPAPGSCGRFIGLTKVLPIVQGALFTTADAALATHVRRKREERSAWSWPVWLTMLALRRGHAGGHSNAADAAYEMYFAAGGGNPALRGNIAAVLERVAAYEAETRERLAAIEAALGARVLMPDLRRLGYLVPLVAGERLEDVRAIFRAHGFPCSPLHLDLARNLLAPRYEKIMPIPLNPRVRRSAFDRLIEALARLESANEPVAVHAAP